MSKLNNSRIIIGVVIILNIIGLVTIYSAGGSNYFFRELIWTILGIGILLATVKIPVRLWENFSIHIFILTFLLLVLVLIVGGGPANRWFDLGFFNFQPSELAKVAIILFIAQRWAYKKIAFNMKDLLIPIVAALSYALLVLLEPDMGTGLIFLPVLAGMMFWHGISMFQIFLLFSPIFSFIFGFSIYLWIGYFVGFAIITYRKTTVVSWLIALMTNILAGLSSPIIWANLKEYQKARIIGFLSPWLDPKGMSWNLIQSQIAVGSGRIFGKGFLSGTQKKLAFLPNRETDFIFSTLSEEFGFVGAILTLTLYFFLLYQIYKIAQKTQNEFARLVAIGIFLVFSYQIIVNIGMVLGLLPITGIALPFLSYGGSSLIVSYLMIGLAIRIYKENQL
ncbi:MAG: rod shape-determining protein RodA [candidate division WOR-3 bacterium]|nr:rod shape-determining protein RodA [candidate division WOR-3 bacterium]MDW7987237.1 rod shape-determining protein RodA [candidate division WOR-3 bacterium]